MRRMERTFALRSLVAAALLALTLTLFAGAASAQDYSNPPPTSTGPTTTQQAPPEDTEDTTVTRSEALPVTGSDLAGIAVIGGGLVLVGGGVLLARRRTA
jgi:LPXTG-motif cell wall-anchored protein